MHYLNEGYMRMKERENRGRWSGGESEGSRRRGSRMNSGKKGGREKAKNRARM